MSTVGAVPLRGWHKWNLFNISVVLCSRYTAECIKPLEFLSN